MKPSFTIRLGPLAVAAVVGLGAWAMAACESDDVNQGSNLAIDGGIGGLDASSTNDAGPGSGPDAAAGADGGTGCAPGATPSPGAITVAQSILGSWHYFGVYQGGQEVPETDDACIVKRGFHIGPEAMAPTEQDITSAACAIDNGQVVPFGQIGMHDPQGTCPAITCAPDPAKWVVAMAPDGQTGVVSVLQNGTQQYLTKVRLINGKLLVSDLGSGPLYEKSGGPFTCSN